MAENDALRDVAAGRRRLHISSLSVSAATTTASGVDNAASPTGGPALSRIISPSERLVFFCKNNWKETSILIGQCR